MPLRVTLLQTDIHWNQPEENIREVEGLMAQIDNCQAYNKANENRMSMPMLYVLPEMWSTGFATEPEGIAADEDTDIALSWMRQTACSRQCALCGSIAIRLTDGTYRNRNYFVDGISGKTTFYDKHHLFTYGHENRYYTPGEEHTVVQFGGFRFLLLTCYDLRFPVWSRYATGREYDAIIIVANWPASRQSAWQLLTRARAIENQCYLIGVNRVGDDQYNHYQGASCVIDAYGKTLAQCHKNSVEALSVDIDLEELQHRRNKFCVLNDRDEII